MTQRIAYQKQSSELFRKFVAFSIAFEQSAIEESVRDLVDMRAPQINGCAFCVDMNAKAATMRGERALRLYHLARVQTVQPERTRRAGLDGSPDPASRPRRAGRRLRACSCGAV